MNKTELIAEVARDTRFKKKEVEEMMNSLIDITERELSTGETVRIVGFGTFIPEHKEDRVGTHPATQEKIIIKGRNTVKFKPGKELKDIMN